MAAAWTAELINHMQTRAVALGFDRAGVAAAPAAATPAGAPTAQRFSAWVEAGHAGEMDYLKRRNDAGELLRASATTAIPWARSILVCAFNYNAAGPRSIDIDDPTRGWIARYAWNGDEQGHSLDYHNDLLKRLRSLEAALLQRVDCQARCYVDTGPLLERDFAARSGIGWIGKNTCVINQDIGSWLLLGVIVTSLDPLPNAVLNLAPDRCGTCTRCIDACPTNALLATQQIDGPRQMDASRCISYLTIEMKGSIPLDLRSGIGAQVFGCDICQDVCPWNSKAPVAHKDGLRTRPELIAPSLDWLASLDQPAFKQHFAGSPLERTRRKRLLRNVAIAMGNSGRQRFVPRLQQWSTGDDPVLAEAAQWALQQLAASINPEDPHAARPAAAHAR